MGRTEPGPSRRACSLRQKFQACPAANSVSQGEVGPAVCPLLRGGAKRFAHLLRRAELGFEPMACVCKQEVVLDEGTMGVA